jgi:membrane fusion protein (multidrug efflux system)
MLLVGLMLCLMGCGGSSGNDASTAEADSTQVTEADAAGKPQAGDRENSDEPKEQAIVVEVEPLQRGPIESVIRAAANLEAESSVEVLAEASRRVVERLAEEGDVVKKGQLLLRLESEEQTTALKRAETNHDQALREYERQKNLHERNLTTEQAFNDAADEVKRTELLLEDARRELSYTEVRAPIAGTVTERLVNVGNQVTIGQHLFSIIDFESIVAYVYIPEKDLKELSVGQDVRVQARAVREEPYNATIERIAPVVDPRSGTVKVTVGVGGKPGLRPGLYVDVAVVTATLPDALLVPKRALLYDNDQIFVYKLEPERRVKKMLVHPVLSDADNIVPRTGFAAGDSIVVAGQTGLKDNALVRLTTDPEPSEEDDAEGGEQTTAAAEDAS